MRRLMTALICCILTVFETGSAAGQEFADRLQDYKRQQASESIGLLRQLISMPNVSADQENVRKNAEFIAKLFAERGARMELLEIPAANPVVYGEIKSPESERTVVIYAHFDGQPVNPARWQATRPFEPALFSQSIAAGGQSIEWPNAASRIDPEWRIYGRSASDDKAPFVALLTALDALREFDVTPTSNINFFFDGEEEIGSPNMERVLTEHRDKFDDVDLWVFCDGPLHQSRQPTLYYGVRGVTGMELTVYGASRNLHSGHYGNWAPNPAMMLAQLLASMKDEDGNVLVEGFYDSVIPLTDAELRALDQVPAVDERLRDELGLVQSEANNAPYLQRMQLPSLNIRGLQSADVGKNGRNVIPNEAVASIDIRLVKGNRPAEMLQLVERHIRNQGYFVTRGIDPTAQQRRTYPRIAKITTRDGYPAARTAMNTPQVQPLVSRLSEFLKSDQPLLQIPSLGGSLPLYLITEGEKKPLVILPLANHDNNQHAPDENLRLGNFMYGIDAMAAVLTMPPQ